MNLRLNPSPGQISDWEFVRIDGTGTIQLDKGGVVDIRAVGYFRFYHYLFLVHFDIENPGWYSVSEASTGAIVSKYCYETPEDAIQSVKETLTNKKFYLATRVSDILVERQINLLDRNTTNLQTLAIDVCL